MMKTRNSMRNRLLARDFRHDAQERAERTCLRGDASTGGDHGARHHDYQLGIVFEMRGTVSSSRS